MRAINHALTGAVIGLSIDNPALSLPAAFLSHFVCDAIPHWGFGDISEKQMEAELKKDKFKNGLIIDAFLCFLLVLLLACTHPKNWIAASIGAFLAASPDFLSIRRYISTKKGHPFEYSKLEKLLADIQWFERPSGLAVEVVWFTVFSVLLWNFIR